MRHISTDKYTIAWFKLAECVARGEREKAFGVYRLLAHSLSDQAYAYKLEADLLHLFEDQSRAVEKYALAAQLYVQEQRWYEAAGMYEQLKSLGALTSEYIYAMVIVHHALGNREYARSLLAMLIERTINAEDYRYLVDYLALLEEVAEQATVQDIYKTTVIKLIGCPDVSHDLIVIILRKALKMLCMQRDSSMLTAFLTEIAALNTHYHTIGTELLATLE